MARATYTKKQRKDAIALYREHGPAEASRRAGIRAATIRSWAARAGVHRSRAKNTRAATEAAAAEVARKREELKLMLVDAAQEMIRRQSEPHVTFVGQFGRREETEHPPAADCRQYMTSAAIAIDKLELLEGRATGRFDGRMTVQSQLDREIEDLLSHYEPKGNGASRVPA